MQWLLHGTKCCKDDHFNTLRQRQDGRLFPDDIFKSIFFNENVQILIKISLTFVPKASINNIPALVQIMAWRRPGNKPLSEPMMVSLLTHICVTRPQWVKSLQYPCRVLSWKYSPGINEVQDNRCHPNSKDKFEEKKHPMLYQRSTVFYITDVNPHK